VGLIKNIMNYRHSYHAGNFGDVLKHITLIALLQALSRKENAFCVLDTHAGVGRYDLLASTTQKSKEYVQGIGKIWHEPNTPPLIKDYIDCIRQMNTASEALRFYPGSPAITRYFLRPQDRMILTELHEEDWQLLKTHFSRDKQIAIHHHDAYQALKAFLPPKERRGLVLIDPAYEQPDELNTAVSALSAAVTRWPTGVFALWYPIKESRSIIRFQRALKLKISEPLLAIELNIYSDNLPHYLNGCGMIIVNPPWQLKQTIEEIVPWLWKKLSINKQGKYDVKML
jgi:23S rRNA (adenine2030-N6)-methyltransferase